MATPDAGDERTFYELRRTQYEALYAKCEAILIGDTSQDADEEDD